MQALVILGQIIFLIFLLVVGFKWAVAVIAFLLIPVGIIAAFVWLVAYLFGPASS